jgi:hypothetical protein
MHYHSLANVADFERGLCFKAPGYYTVLLIKNNENYIHIFVIIIRYSDTFLTYTAPLPSITEESIKLK